ncbi:MAG: rhodanese-like domain-containing protein [Thermodesulfobacteriota bacterium]|nr:rhodanese-like domain-containing protein [Thermodesulfobacteriota bacterium]
MFAKRNFVSWAILVFGVMVIIASLNILPAAAESDYAACEISGRKMLIWGASLKATLADEILEKGKEGLFISASELQDILTNEHPTDDPLVLDVRKEEHYILEHIGYNHPDAEDFTTEAIWICDWDEVAEWYNMLGIYYALRDHVEDGGAGQIVAVCYTGHTAGMATSVLNFIGFEAKNLKHGYCLSWNNCAEGCDKKVIPLYDGGCPVCE